MKNHIEIMNNSFAVETKDADFFSKFMTAKDHIIHNEHGQSSDTLIVALFNRLSPKTN